MEMTFPISGVETYIWLPPLVAFAWLIVAGTLPGVVSGGLIRLHFLFDPKQFKVFVGCVLLYVGIRLFCGMYLGAKTQRFVSAGWLKGLLGLLLLLVALNYMANLMEVMRPCM